MTHAQYQHQMDRLASQFGRGTYSLERLNLFWREVQSMGLPWFERTIDRFLITCRHAPLYPEFAEAIAQDREYTHAKDKRENSECAHAFMSKYSGQDIQTICGQIRDRIQAKMTDTEFTGMTQMLSHMGEPFQCGKCSDTKWFSEPSKSGTWGLVPCPCRSK